MDFTALLPIAIFGLVTLALWAVLGRFVRGGKTADDRLDELRGLVKTSAVLDDAEETDWRVEKIVRDAVPTLSSVLAPKDRRENDKIRLRLSHAGFNAPAAVAAYFAVKTVTMAAGALLGGAISLSLSDPGKNSVAGVVLGAAAGLMAPNLVLGFVIRRRQERIFLALPDAVDLLVVCIEVGQGLDAALQEVTRELKGTAPDLCAEFDLYLKHVLFGKSHHAALHDLGVRSGVKDLHSLAMVVVQTKKFGTGIAESLRQLSEGMRIKRRQLAEERAQKTSVQLLFPLVLFIFPGVFTVLVGPAAISVMRDMLGVR